MIRKRKPFHSGLAKQKQLEEMYEVFHALDESDEKQTAIRLARFAEARIFDAKWGVSNMGGLVVLLVWIVLLCLIGYLVAKLNMLPASACDNFPYMAGAYAVLLRNIRIGFTMSRFATYFKYLRLCQLGSMDRCAFVERRDWMIASALFRHVLYVVFGCAEKQMIRAHTGRRIAFMADMQATGNWPIVKFIAETMSKHGCIPKRNFTISRRKFATLPQPARITLEDVGPKAFFEWWVLRAKMMKNKSLRLSFDHASVWAIVLCNRRKLTAAALAVAIRDFLRVILGKAKLKLHRKFILSDAKPRGTRKVSPGYVYV